MTSNRANRTDRSTPFAVGCVIVLAILLTLLVVAAIVWRSAWWTGAEPALPRGTERYLPFADLA
jgi:hypothetical protein